MTNISYDQPDLARIQESREAIRYQAIIGSANLYIKALSDELLGLNAAVSELDLTAANTITCLLYTSPSPRDRQKSRMPSSA